MVIFKTSCNYRILYIVYQLTASS